MAKKPKRMEPWRGWLVIDADGNHHSEVYYTRLPADELRRSCPFPDRLRIVRVLVTEIPTPKRSQKP